MSEELRNSDACSGDCAGCGGDCTSFDSEKQTITLTLDDDSQLECRVINIFQAKEQKYIVLLPLDSTDGEGYLFRFFQEEGGNPRLENIDDEDEYSFAADVFENLMSQAGFLEPEEQEDESAQE